MGHVPPKKDITIVRSCIIFSAVVLLLGSPAILLGQTTAAPSPNFPDSVIDRMNRLEAETQSLRAEVEWLREHPVRLPTVDATHVSMATNPGDYFQAGEGDYFTMDELRGEMKKFAWKKGEFSIVPYGILWANTVYSTERTTPGSYTLFVQSASTGPESEFVVDARNTRLGVDVGGPRIPFFNCAKGGGKIEVDFQQNLVGTARENRPTVMLRHAYAEVKNEEFRLLCGQTWDVISPLYPGTLMYSVGWYGGNIGYRRAQFRGERYLTFSDVSLVTAQLSINQQIFEDAKTPLASEPSSWPVLEGRIAWTVGQRGPGCLPITIGLSGHIGEEDASHIGMADHHSRTWSGNLDIRVPITDRFGIQGECQTGENLGAFLGGIGQGIDPTLFNAIRDTGGWVEVWYDWTPRLHSHFGFSVDDPNDNDLHTAGERSYNQFYYGNLSFDITKKFLVGLELSSWKTLYVDRLPGDAMRCEFVAKYGF